MPYYKKKTGGKTRRFCVSGDGIKRRTAWGNETGKLSIIRPMAKFIQGEEEGRTKKRKYPLANTGAQRKGGVKLARVRLRYVRLKM